MKKERVELHIHTKKSEMDGVASIGEYIKQAAVWGHTAIAVTDHGCVQAFPEAMRAAEECEKQGHKIKILYGMEAYCANDVKAQPFHLTILVKNQSGLKNLYCLVSWSYLHHFQGIPIITEEELQKHRTGLLIGSGCGNGQLFLAAAQGKPADELCAIAQKYDFLEIQPVWNCKCKAPKNKQEELQKINGVIVQIGKEVQVPVCATGNVHYLKPEDIQARCILKNIYGATENESSAALHFRSTKEMLNAFDYLGKEKAREVVIDNTNKFADRVEKVRPIPAGRSYPCIADAEKRLNSMVRSRAEALYGNPLPDIVKERIEKELSVVWEQKTASLFLIARQQIERAKQQGYPVMARGTAGASLLSFLAGISEINPLPPHYRCPNCRHTEFFTHAEIESGFDLPQKACPICGRKMQHDGQNVLWQDFFGVNGEKMPDFDLNFSDEYISCGYAKRYLEELFGKTQVVNAGTMTTVSERLARQYLLKHEEKTGAPFSKKTKERLINLLTGVKRAVGQHPGGLVIIPKNSAAEDFTPLQYAGIDSDSAICTHFDFHDRSKPLLKLDDLGYDVPTLYHYLEIYTGISVANADLSDTAVYERLFTPVPTKAEANFLLSPAVRVAINGLPGTYLKKLPPKNFGGLRKAFESRFPKAYAAELALAAVRLSWYRLYYPKEFDKAYQCADLPL